MTATPAAQSPLQPLPIDVVSVQSQVVYGSVGNCVAVPTLQKLGLRVAAVPTVVLSNTPHYPTIHGGALPTEWFAGYLDDLGARGALAHLRAIQLGYLGSAGQAEALARWIDSVLADSDEVRVHIDPVIGDHDHGVYIDPAIVAVYRERLLPLWQRYASLPEHLQQATIDTLENALGQLDHDWLARIEAAHQRNPRDVRLQYLAGAAYLKNQLWGKGQFVLQQVAQNQQCVQNQPDIARRAWLHLAQLAETQGRAQDAQDAWKRAALLTGTASRA